MFATMNLIVDENGIWMTRGHVRLELTELMGREEPVSQWV